MSPSETHPFTIKVMPPHAGNFDTLTRIEVFDGQGTRRAEGSGLLETALPKGLYTVRMNRLGELREEVLVHRGTTEKALAAPLRNSAMPMNDTAHHHEFLQGPAQRFSTQSTFETGLGPEFPRLMIMIRTGDTPGAQQNLGADMTLIDQEGRVVTRFEPERTDTAESVFSLFSARLLPGNYMLSRQAGDRAELMPITLFPKWDCFVFVPFEGHAKLSAASIKLVKRGRGYDPGDIFASELDAAIQGLGDRLRLLPEHLRREAIHGKFEHPLHGLIGAYAHFQGPDHKQRLEAQVLHNLWRLLPLSTDVIALLLMSMKRTDVGLPDSIAALNAAAAQAFGEGIGHLLPLSFPPLLSAGLSAIVQAGADLPGLIEQGSWLDVAANTSVGAGVWAIWDQPNPALQEQPEAVPSPLAKPPSTQLLYPAVKRALAQRSGKLSRDIRASTNLRDILSSDGFEDLGGIMGAVNESVSGFSMSEARPALNRETTVRELVHEVRKVAQPEGSQPVEAVTPQIARPVLEVPDWLIDTVQDRIAAEGDGFDPKRLARQYAITTGIVETAASMPRPARDQ